LKRFEERWGAGRIILSYGDATVPPSDLEQADVVFAYNLHSEEARALAPRLQPLLTRGVRVLAHWPEGAERHWSLKQDPVDLQAAVEYWNYGGAENMARLFAFVCARRRPRRGWERVLGLFRSRFEPRGEPKRRSAAEPAFRSDLASHHFHELLADCEAQPGPA
jgi:hypothetical protein